MDKKSLLTQKIQELKLRAAPINYSNTSVNEFGELAERESLLDQRIAEGYGLIWGKPNLHQERFFKGAFSKSISDNGPGSGANYEIKFRDEHGRACALFDVLIEDEIGLYFRTKPFDDVSWANDLLVQLRSKTINNFSAGFKHIITTEAIKWNESDKCLDIFQARLFEISGVAIPSDLATFAIRSAVSPEDVYDQTEDFISSLPRKDQLQARKLFALHKSLIEAEPFEQRNTTLDTDEPTKKGIDYNYLINNLKN